MKQNNILGLYDHNIKSYEKIKNAYASGEKIVGILHATGTGKTLNALQLAYDNPDKQIIFLTPYNSIIEHIKELIEEIPGVDINRDFGHVKFMTYASLVHMSKSDLSKLDVDMLMLDEFHHIGAPVWGDRVNSIIETHPELLIFGMSAYSIRDRGTSYERDLAEPDSDELFSGKIVSRYDLVDAMMDGVLPVPVYRSAYVKLLELEEELEEKVNSKYHNSPLYDDYMKKLRDAKKKISCSLDANNLLLRNVKKGGKYIYFCPPLSKNGVNDIKTIMEETKNAFLANGYTEDELCFYMTTSEDYIDGKINRKSFYNDTDLDGNDVSDKLRIIFAINQYNEGVHAPNVDGVILGRETESDIIFFEQIGRGLSVRGDTKDKIIKYQGYSFEELKSLALESDIVIDEYMTKDDIIERLVAPKIIDLTGNYSFIKDLITDLKHRIREYSDEKESIDRIIKLTENSFDVEILGHDLFNTLMNIKNDFMPQTWEDSFELAVRYFNCYGNLKIMRDFKTDDGENYNEFGYALGEWIMLQRKNCKSGTLSDDRIKKLNSIGMIWSSKKTWDESFLLASKFYNKYKHLKIKYDFKTDDGVSFYEYGYSLGLWIINQRRKYKLGRLNKNEIEKLESIGMLWQIVRSWEDSFELAKNYYVHFGNLNIKKSFRTNDGFTKDEKGYGLGKWLSIQKNRYHEGKLKQCEINKLELIGIDWSLENGNKRENDVLDFEGMYKLAKNFYDAKGHLKIVRSFKTFDGVTYHKDGYNLGGWISRQRVFKKENKLPNERVNLLNKIEMQWNEDVVHKDFMEAYELAMKYYLENGCLDIKTDFKTTDGIEYDEKGYALGAWIYIQRKKYDNDELDEERIILLNRIGMIWSVNQNYSKIKQLLHELGLNPRRYSKEVKQLSFMEFSAKVRYLIDNDIPIVNDKKLHEIFNMSDTNLLLKYGISRDDLVDKYVGLGKRV